MARKAREKIAEANRVLKLAEKAKQENIKRKAEQLTKKQAEARALAEEAATATQKEQNKPEQLQVRKHFHVDWLWDSI